MATQHPHMTSTAAAITAAQAIDAIREQLGKSRVASEWSRLSLQQRAMLCYGAKLRPSTYAEMAIEDMTSDEREQIRVALVAMKTGIQVVTTTDPQEWRQAGKFKVERPPTQQQQARTEQLGRMKLNQQARQLDRRLSSLKAKSPVSGN